MIGYFDDDADVELEESCISRPDRRRQSLAGLFVTSALPIASARHRGRLYPGGDLLSRIMATFGIVLAGRETRNRLPVAVYNMDLLRPVELGPLLPQRR